MVEKPKLVLPPKPDGKYSDWCEKKPWPPWDIRDDVKAVLEARKMGLSDKELAAYVSHKHMNVKGLEFEMTGNLELEKPVMFPNGLTIVPCFLADLDQKPLGDNLVYKSFEMMTKSVYEYDCWMPIEKWDRKTIRKSITQIDELMSIFSLLAHIYFTWKPKYHYDQETQEGQKHSTKLSQENLKMIQNLYTSVSNYPEKDNEAILSSIGWFSQAFRQTENSSKFLFFFFAIESLVSYIEQKTDNTSPFFKFKTDKITPTERAKQQIECIEGKLETIENKIQAVSEAYFDCVVPLKRTMKSHLSKVFSNKQEWINLIFDTKNGKSLYDLRSEIAHGRLNSLSPEENKRIQEKLYDVQKIAFNYITTIIKGT